MQVTVLRGMRIDLHATDGITHAFTDPAIFLLAIVLPGMVVTRMAMIMMWLRGRRSGLRRRLGGATARLV